MKSLFTHLVALLMIVSLVADWTSAEGGGSAIAKNSSSGPSFTEQAFGLPAVSSTHDVRWSRRRLLTAWGWSALMVGARRIGFAGSPATHPALPPPEQWKDQLPWVPPDAHLPKKEQELEVKFEKEVRQLLPPEYQHILFLITAQELPENTPQRDPKKKPRVGRPKHPVLVTSVDTTKDPFSLVLIGNIAWRNEAESNLNIDRIPRDLPFYVRHETYHLGHIIQVLRNCRRLWEGIRTEYFPGDPQIPENTEWKKWVFWAMHYRHEYNAQLDAISQAGHSLVVLPFDARSMLAEDLYNFNDAYAELLKCLGKTPKDLDKWIKDQLANPEKIVASPQALSAASWINLGALFPAMVFWRNQHSMTRGVFFGLVGLLAVPLSAFLLRTPLEVICLATLALMGGGLLRKLNLEFVLQAKQTRSRKTPELPDHSA